jgi:hypothetical protein
MAMADAAPEKKPATAQASEPEKMVTFAALFRTADQQDKVLVALGTLASCTVGMAMPVFSIIFGAAPAHACACAWPNAYASLRTRASSRRPPDERLQ